MWSWTVGGRIRFPLFPPRRWQLGEGFQRSGWFASQLIAVRCLWEGESVGKSKWRAGIAGSCCACSSSGAQICCSKARFLQTYVLIVLCASPLLRRAQAQQCWQQRLDTAQLHCLQNGNLLLPLWWFKYKISTLCRFGLGRRHRLRLHRVIAVPTELSSCSVQHQSKKQSQPWSINLFFSSVKWTRWLDSQLLGFDH